MRRFLSLGVLLLALAGCGGGGGGSTPVTPATGQEAVTDATKAAYAYSYAYALSASATRSAATPEGLIGLVRYTIAGSQGTRGWKYDSTLHLYYQVTHPSLLTVHIDFSSSPDGTGPTAGSMDITLTDPPPYPIAARVRFDLTTRQTHLSGSIDVTVYDSQLSHVHAKGGYQSTSPTTSLSFNLDYNQNVVTGSLSASVNGRTVTFTNITKDAAGDFGADFSVGGVTGSIAVNADGSGQVTATNLTRTYTVTWGTDLVATLTEPDGSKVSLGPIQVL